MVRAVFFDLDGTLNEAVIVACKPYLPASAAVTRLSCGPWWPRSIKRTQVLPTANLAGIDLAQR
jgi:phosphoglycolate phosphatase-like HAD superfamily hydrolase